MEALVRKFLKEKKISNIIGDDICVPQGGDQEVIVFIKYDRKEQVWNYGRIERGKEEVQAVFEEKEKALMYSIYDNYNTTLELGIRGNYFKDFIKIDEEDEQSQEEFMKNNVEGLYLDKLKINDNENLIYLDEHLIPKQGIFAGLKIMKFYFIQIYTVMAYDQTVNELINFGFNKKELDRYYRFEELELRSIEKYM